MGLFDMLLGGHHGSRRHGGHHDDDDHHRPRQDYGHGWGHSGGAPGDCGNGSPPVGSQGKNPGSVVGTVNCSNCQTANGSGVRFCQQCGTSLVPLKCAQCGASVAGGSKFCGQCGKAC